MFPRVAEVILVWAFPWPSGRRPAQGPPRLQVLVDELQAFLAAGHLVGFKSVDGEGRLSSAERPVTGPVVDDAQGCWSTRRTWTEPRRNAGAGVRGGRWYPGPGADSLPALRTAVPRW